MTGQTANAAVPAALGAALSDRYRIVRELGRGGMATVYLAEDVRHRRNVAIKVLHPELTAVIGAERFLKEIELTAGLQHPHILPLFDSGEADGQLFYVMPFVDGETLRARLERETQLPVADALSIARETADALQYAHERGVIHRDIKPENILLQGGHALVADFGIALAVQQAGGQRMTQTGLSLGTPQYMAPEQAMGDRNVDARADVYALGAVVYEMLAGEPPFTGASAQAIVAKVLTATPAPIAQTRATVPPQVEHAVATALAKLPADRFASARAFADALTNPSTISSMSAARGASARSWRERSATWLAAAVIVLLATTVWALTRHEASPTIGVTRLDVMLPVATRRSDVMISPDGSTLAFAGTVNGDTAVFVRRLDGEPTFHKLAGSDGALGAPAFSPDNQWIVFRRRDSSFVKISVNGGGAVTITRSPLLTNYPHWGTADLIIGSTSAGIWRYPLSGDAPKMIVANTGRFARLLPDGSGILFARGASIFVYDLKTNAVTELVKRAQDPEYVKTGHLLYISDDGSLVAVPFDLHRHAITGAPVNLVDHIGGLGPQRGYSVSETGVLVYRDGARSRGLTGQPTQLVSLSLDGGIEPLTSAGGTQVTPRVSHDGATITYATQRPAKDEESDIFTVDLATKRPSQLTFSGDSYAPVWSLDDKRILFSKGKLGDADLYERPAENSGAEHQVLAMPLQQVATAWMQDGTIAFESSDNLQSDLYTYNPKTGGQPKPYLNAAWSESDFNLSPDGTLAVVRSLETGSPEVWIRGYPDPQSKWRVAGGTSPKWSPDGKYVYYWHVKTGPDSLFRARIDRTRGVVVQQPEAVLEFSTREQGAAAEIGWDFFPDGKRIVIAQLAASPQARADTAAALQMPARYVVVLNWFTELKARMRSQSARP